MYCTSSVILLLTKDNRINQVGRGLLTSLVQFLAQSRDNSEVWPCWSGLENFQRSRWHNPSTQLVSTTLPSLNTVWFCISLKNSGRIARIQIISLLGWKEEKLVCIGFLLLFRSIWLFCFVLHFTPFKTMHHALFGKYQRSIILLLLSQENKFSFSVLFLAAVLIFSVLLHDLRLSSQHWVDFLSHGFMTQSSHILESICSSNNSW